MLKFKDLSIRRKLFIGILSFSMLLVLSVTAIASTITYNSMRNQLIYNRRMSIRWLQDRLSLEVESISDQFYEFEVNKELQEDIKFWYSSDKELDYSRKINLITAMNEMISMDKNMKSMEICNYAKEEALVAKRSGAGMEEIGDKLDIWKKRDSKLQTNIAFFRNAKEIIISHQTYNFNNKKPMVLITMKLFPYEMEDILEDIQATKDESILIFNDQNELIDARYGDGFQYDDSLVSIIEKLSNSKEQEIYQDGSFWFWSGVKGKKLQILMTVPNRSLVSALNNTVFGGILVGLAAVIISTIGSILFSRAFSKPIINLSALMRTITIEDYADINSEKRKDEIGILQDSFHHMIDRNKRLIEQDYQSNIEKREAQLRALQAQINPHFMYNTLQVIGGMALKNKLPQIYKITTALGDILRYSLNFSDEMVSLKKEIQYFESYLMIQNERFGNRINLEIRIQDELMDYELPKLILQPLLENSLEHGLSNKSGDWHIKLEAELLGEDDLRIALTDNGVGIEKERLALIQEDLRNSTEKVLKASSHIGLCNVNARILLEYSDSRCGVSIESVYGEGTKVQVLVKAIRGGNQNVTI